MKISKLSKSILSGFFGALLLTGFTGQEKYVELEGFLNGRSSAYFTSSSRNIRALLPKGSRGEILEHQKLPSGNFGLRIRVLNGAQKDQTFWVYHRVADSDMTLYKTAPWASPTAIKTATVSEAHAMETIRETQARTEPPTPEAALNLITRANSKIQSTALQNCNNCSTTSTGPELPLLRAGGKPLAEACNEMMNSIGELGPHGQSLFSVMAEPDYARHFTSDNALGHFCPNFNSLTDKEKLTAWTWFWTALAMEESSCNVTQEHGTTYKDREGNVKVLNPREGYGLWALERDRNVRRWRGEACSRIGSAENQARCAVDIMTQTQLVHGRTAANTTMSYWGPVRRGLKQIIPHMRRLSLCF